MKQVKEFFVINAGLLLVALGIYLFKIPDKFVTGGVSGIAILAGRFFPNAPIGAIMLGINIFLLLLGFVFLGSDFGYKTVYSSFALSGMVWVLEKIYMIKGSLTGDLMLELVFAIMLPAIGSAIVFNCNSSTGGTDIVAKILSKYTDIHIGKTLLIADFAIASGAFLVYGLKIGMYSILGLILRAFVIDLVIEGLNISKVIVVISDKPEVVMDFIVKELKRGATVHKAYGAYTHDEKEVITTVVGRRQAVRLRNFVRSVDDKAFITITNSSEIIGKGFRSIT